MFIEQTGGVTENNNTILALRNLSLQLNGRKILSDLSVEFWRGHIHAIVGPNGAGKSTMASVIMGLSGYEKTEGEIKFEGKPINSKSIYERAKSGITLAWQEPARYEGLPVKDFILSSAREKNIDTVKSALEDLGMDSGRYIDRAVDKTLSGGERKKIELASILAMQPKVALLDEPDSGIDIESIQRIFDAVKKLKGLGTTVILITHSLAVLEQAEHAFLMCNGKIVEKGVADKIKGFFEGNCIPCDHKNEPIKTLK